MKKEIKEIAKNKKISNFEILESLEAGIELKGFEVKAIKEGKVSLHGAYVIPKGEELFLVGAKVAPYQPLNVPQDYKKDRDRKLLLHKREIKSLIGKVSQKGLTLLPKRLYTKGNKIKVEIVLAKAKKKFKKKEEIKKRELDLELQRLLKKWG